MCSSCRGSTGERDRARAEAALAAAWAAAHRAAGRPAPPGPAARLSLRDVAALWLAQAEERERAGEVRPYYVQRHRYALELALGQVEQLDVSAEAWTQASRRMHEAGASWRTIQICTYALGAVLRYAAELGALESAPDLSPPAPHLVARDQAPRRALSAAERERLLRELRRAGHDSVARGWEALAFTGLRRAELARLTLRWLDLRAGTLTVPAGAAKSSRQEAIPLHDRARRAILAEARARGICDPGEVVFGRSDWRKAVRSALARAGIDPHGVTPYHTSRHTYGELVAAAAQGDVSAVLAAGRWRSLSVVQRYVHASAARARTAVRRLR